ncbi:hypothetical protein GX586_09570 [bacterium]|nr:hypothetical protein [bacterium]
MRTLADIIAWPAGLAHAFVLSTMLCASGSHAATVFISEFMAQNDSVLADQDGEYSDWIELYNAGTATVNMLGWRLSDNATAPEKWVFPQTNLAPGRFVIVFASGKDRRAGGAELHANFKLSASGEYLGLSMPDGTVAHEYAPVFPAQTADISYGIPSGFGSNSLIGIRAFCRAFVPRDDSLGKSWTSNAFNDSGWLPGATGVGYERGSGYQSGIGLDVGGPMYASNTTCYIRVPFVADDAALVKQLSLQTVFDDGYVPYINGRKGPGANNPEDLSWDAAATGSSGEPEMTVTDLGDLSGALVEGTNVLALHGLNHSVTGSHFLVLPRLDCVRNLFGPGTPPVQLAAPTPGSINGGAFVMTTSNVRFSHPRGFYDAPFALTLSSDTPGATIRYRTDFFEPTVSGGTFYTGPVWISKTTCIRTIAYTNGYHPSECITRTFIFTAQVATQSADQTAAGFPARWVRSDGAVVTSDYAMDQRVVGPGDNYGGVYRASITNDLRSIPAISIVTTMSNLFDRYAGIYSNPGSIGDNWERPCSFEYINDSRDPDGMQINCGLRIHGELNRIIGNRKHSFRFLFKSQYGDAKLNYPLFAGDPVGEYNTIVLRCMYGDSWMNRFGATYLNEQWAHDTQRALGHPVAMHGRHVHLYVNGLYWGLYDAVERPDDAFMNDHVAGPRENWDILQGLITAAEVSLAEGSRAAYDAMMALVPKSPTTTVSDVTYAQLEQYLDMPFYADYMLLQFYSQNYDWPRKNWRVACQRTPASPAGPPAVRFRYTAWDHESALRSYDRDRTTIGNDLADMRGPAQIYKRIRGHRKFKRLFGDRAHKHMFNGGVLCTESNLARWVRLMADVHGAIVAESARWGDIMFPDSPFTRDRFPFNEATNWFTEINTHTNEWFPRRNGVLLTSLRNAGLYPLIDAPVFSQFGGSITNGVMLTISAAAGDIYYTTDGSDPANEDDSVGAGASVYGSPVPLTRNVRVKARARSGGTWSALTEAVFIAGRPDLRVTEVMYHPPAPPAGSPYLADDFEFIELANVGTAALPVRTFALTKGIQFSLGNAALSLAPEQCIVLARNPAAFATRYNTSSYAVVGGYAQSLDNGGEELAFSDAIYGTVQDFAYSDTWFPETDGGGFSLTIKDAAGDVGMWNTQEGWRASFADLGTPGCIEVPEPGCLALLLCAAWCAGRRRQNPPASRFRCCRPSWRAPFALERNAHER